MPKPTPDLRTSNVQLDVQKYSNLPGLQEQSQKLWGLRRIQPYFPSIQKLFKLENVRMPYHYGLKLQLNRAVLNAYAFVHSLQQRQFKPQARP